MIWRGGGAIAGTLGVLAGIAWAPAEVHAQAATADRLDEIVVTARRHEENLQKTPISVVALPGDELDAHSVSNLRDLQGFVPNLTLAAQQNVGEGSGNIFIRGIGQEDFIAGAEPGVGLYLDGVYIATTRGTISDLADIDRIEVLRGPQGTLFGKNSVGGAIQILSIMPKSEPEAKARATYGSFERTELRAMLNLPLGVSLFARLSALSAERDGFMRRLTPPGAAAGLPGLDLRPEGGGRTLAGRLQLRWLAGERFTADLAFDATRKRGTQSAHRLETVDAAASGILALNRLIQLGRLPGPLLSNAILPEGFHETYAAGGQFVDMDGWGASATLARQAARGTIKLILAHRRLKSHFLTDNDGLWYDISSTEFDDSHRQTSTEVQYAGAAGPAEVTAGLFALFERSRSYPVPGTASNGTLYTCDCFYPPNARPLVGAANRDLKGQSYAAYGQATFRLSERLSANLGARYSHERKSVQSQSILNDPDTLLPTGIVLGSGTARDSWNSFTYRLGAEFQATPDLMLYASLAKGYKSGGFNVRIVTGLPNLGLTPYEPEIARTVEIGLRSTWFDKRLRFNATLFHTTSDSLQLRQQKVIAGVTTSQVDNAGKARIRGAEVEIEALPAPRLRLRAAYGHLDPRYLDTGNVPGLTLDSRFQRTPSHSLAASVSYTVPFADGSLVINGDYAYRSREQFQITSSPFDQAGYGLTSARISWRARDGRWKLSLYGTNLGNRRYRTAGRGTSTIAGAPRQFGIELEAKISRDRELPGD